MTGLAIVNGRVLLPDGVTDTEVICDDGRITVLGGDVGAREVIDAGGRLVAPGIVDIHGDAFERQWMPRAKTFFPLPLALAETDRQLAANGITTAFHGLTLSWEPGLRCLDNGVEFVAALAEMQPRLTVDNRLHIRWETFALHAIERVEEWLGDAHKPLLAFNDHTTQNAMSMRRADKVSHNAERAGLSVDDYKALLDSVWARQNDVPGAVAGVAASAREAGVSMLSHDDMTPQMRQDFRALGATIAEFPMNAETATDARQAGEHVVLGAPNVVRGGSHIGAMNAADASEADLCTILASDYYYPALLAAAFRLVNERGMAWEKVWPLVSANPATAAGLDDRGTIEIGQRADLIVIDETAPAAVTATVVAGRPVYRV
ncbi:MAG: alpha-D-ribose 1-methylphosphonate 5-triphosphate diphosphatase [Alphaproteobacteria bacterium]